jgi:hypothetical protein
MKIFEVTRITLPLALVGCAVVSAMLRDPVAEGNKLVLQVEKRVHELLPSREEKRIDEIGWAKDIRTAVRLAKEQGRPVFLFTHDGRINTGRC